jgi:putative endonuclease
MGERLYHVYIMANEQRTLYTGVSGNLLQRILQHKQKSVAGFPRKYDLTKLVYCESFRDVRAAIAREKQIKGWRRVKKLDLIESQNPGWDDLALKRNPRRQAGGGTGQKPRSLSS